MWVAMGEAAAILLADIAKEISVTIITTLRLVLAAATLTLVLAAPIAVDLASGSLIANAALARGGDDGGGDNGHDGAGHH